jgi:hypothetical protein
MSCAMDPAAYQRDPKIDLHNAGIFRTRLSEKKDTGDGNKASLTNSFPVQVVIFYHKWRR